MNIFPLDYHPDKALAAALRKFELQFRYPLGDTTHFHISHGADYSAFYRSMGSQFSLFIAMEEQVCGVIAVVLRTLRRPDGKQQITAYVGDLKVAPQYQGSGLSAQLMRAALYWAKPRCDTGFAVVMEGTAITPDRYSKIYSLPDFTMTNRQIIVGLPVFKNQTLRQTKAIHADQDSVLKLHQRLCQNAYSLVAETKKQDPEQDEIPLISPCQTACGILKNTRLTKQLINPKHKPMTIEHLSYLAYQTPSAVLPFVHQASTLAAKRGADFLFFSLPRQHTHELLNSIRELKPILAPATIYSHGLEHGSPWFINSAEV